MTATAEAAPRRPRVTAAVGAIALNTFREAVRDRILYLLLAFALLMIVSSRVLSMLTVGDEGKIIKDLGLSSISIFGVLTSVFVGVSLVFKEIDKRTVYTLLANPVRRWQFVVGKFAGLALVLLMNVVLMSAALVALLLARGDTVLRLVPAIVLIYVELLLVTAFAFLFSSFANPILSAIGTVATYVVGHLSWSFELLKDRVPEGAPRVLCDVLHAALPNLDRLDVKARVVHDLAVPGPFLGWAALYGVSYALAVLVVACVVFERRDFN